MTRRILVLTGYFLRRLLFSLVGVIYVILALVYWAIFFPPGQGTPDAGNYLVIIGAFGAGMTFLATLTVASRAYRAENYPVIVRLPSRVEYVTAVFSSALLFAFMLQLLVALLAMIRGPQINLGFILEIPPVWISINILAGMLALHASDLVASGWSRVVIFGMLAILLIGRNLAERVAAGLAALVSNMSSFFYSRQWLDIANGFGQISSWLHGNGQETIEQTLGVVFWPFRALSSAIFAGFFTPTQALAPAVILLYATILFLIAADLFATKDLELSE
ncbi:MAG: hypothetical protein R3293_23005 [Candidatus Promineifilaceae bacterium]|nr:hypothetical protein [Candidatus Promineifilaceae bacterium]